MTINTKYDIGDYIKYQSSDKKEEIEIAIIQSISYQKNTVWYGTKYSACLLKETDIISKLIEVKDG